MRTILTVVLLSSFATFADAALQPVDRHVPEPGSVPPNVIFRGLVLSLDTEPTLATADGDPVAATLETESVLIMKYYELTPNVGLAAGEYTLTIGQAGRVFTVTGDPEANAPSAVGDCVAVLDAPVNHPDGSELTLECDGVAADVAYLKVFRGTTEQGAVELLDPVPTGRPLVVTEPDLDAEHVLFVQPHDAAGNAGAMSAAISLKNEPFLEGHLADDEGGCNAGGGAGLLLALLAFWTRARRR